MDNVLIQGHSFSLRGPLIIFIEWEIFRTPCILRLITITDGTIKTTQYMSPNSVNRAAPLTFYLYRLWFILCTIWVLLLYRVHNIFLSAWYPPILFLRFEFVWFRKSQALFSQIIIRVACIAVMGLCTVYGVSFFYGLSLPEKISWYAGSGSRCKHLFDG